MSILWDFSSYLSVIKKPLGLLTVGTEDKGNGVYLLKAGTPISENGEVANDEAAKYLVAEDYYFYSNTANQAKMVRLIEKGYVDLSKAEAAAGVTFSDGAKFALNESGVVLVDGKMGSGVPSVSEDDDGKFLRVVDGAWAAATVDAWQGGSY